MSWNIRCDIVSFIYFYQKCTRRLRRQRYVRWMKLRRLRKFFCSTCRRYKFKVIYRFYICMSTWMTAYWKAFISTQLILFIRISSNSKYTQQNVRIVHRISTFTQKCSQCMNKIFSFLFYNILFFGLFDVISILNLILFLLILSFPIKNFKRNYCHKGYKTYGPNEMNKWSHFNAFSREKSFSLFSLFYELSKSCWTEQHWKMINIPGCVFFHLPFKHYWSFVGIIIFTFSHENIFFNFQIRSFISSQKKKKLF